MKLLCKLTAAVGLAYGFFRRGRPSPGSPLDDELVSPAAPVGDEFGPSLEDTVMTRLFAEAKAEAQLAEQPTVERPALTVEEAAWLTELGIQFGPEDNA